MVGGLRGFTGAALPPLARVRHMAGAPDSTPPSISVTEHRQRILDSITQLPARLVPLADALGHTLSVDVHAGVDVPGFDNSAMDGYALRQSDAATASETSPVTLRVVGDLPAGSALNPRLKPGTAVRIMTGAPVPDDADCIVPVEQTDAGLNSVRIHHAPALAAHIRRTGTDIRRDELVLPAGRALGARELAAAAATGIAELPVHPAPRVGVLSTGDELKQPHEPLNRGQIYDSNSVLLAALVAEAGGVPVQLGSVPDDNEQLHDFFARNAGRVDAFVTSGGVSVGAFDVVKAVLAPLGVWFGPVRMQPGKPQGYGQWNHGTPIFALPGNPVSVFVSFEAFVRPALLTMQGQSDVLRPRIRAVATEDWRSPAGRAQYIPVVMDTAAGTTRVRPASGGGSGSYLVASLAAANALAMIPEDVTEVRAGDIVEVERLSGGPEGATLGEL